METIFLTALGTSGTFFCLIILLSKNFHLLKAASAASSKLMTSFHKLACCFHHISVYWIRFKRVKPFQVVHIHISQSFSESGKKSIKGFGFGAFFGCSMIHMNSRLFLPNVSKDHS